MLRSKNNGFLHIRQMTDVKKAIFFGVNPQPKRVASNGSIIQQQALQEPP
jgi:hypothetical protein